MARGWWVAGGVTVALLLSAAVTGCAAHGDGAGPPAGRPTTSTTSTTGPVAFDAAVQPVSADQVAASWHAGCPLPVDQLRAIDATYWGFDARAHEGRIIVAADQVAAVASVLRALYDARYPIHKMEPVDRYGGRDEVSVLADNTSGFNCRPATGSTSWSEHAYGRAIDLNPLENPYVRGATVLPPQSAPLLDRTRRDEGIIHAGDAAVRAFAEVGWIWGGQWPGATKDFQHFSPSGR